jgi:hypothetical protein
MTFVSAFLIAAKKLAETAPRRLAFFAPDGRVDCGKKIERTGDAFDDGARLLELSLPRSFGI